MAKMTKSQMLQALAEKTGVSKKEATTFVDALVELALTEVKGNGEFTIPGIGKLVKQHRKARMGRNPATGEEISLDLIGGHAYVTWLETKHSHWYAKMGLSWVDFEDEIPMTGTFSDEAIGPSIGLGVDWGSPRYAFFFDWDLTFFDLEVLPGEKESIHIGATIVGFIFKF